MNALFFGFDAGTSVEMKRLHDQLLPNVTQFERGFEQVIIKAVLTIHSNLEMILKANAPPVVILYRHFNYHKKSVIMLKITLVDLVDDNSASNNSMIITEMQNFSEKIATE